LGRRNLRSICVFFIVAERASPRTSPQQHGMAGGPLQSASSRPDCRLPSPLAVGGGAVARVRLRACMGARVPQHGVPGSAGCRLPRCAMCHVSVCVRACVVPACCRWRCRLWARLRACVGARVPRRGVRAAHSHLPIAYRRPRWWAVLLRGCGCVCAWVRVCLGPAAVGATPTPRLCVREAVRRCCGAASH
jgi:hypothetical protein